MVRELNRNKNLLVENPQEQPMHLTTANLGHILRKRTWLFQRIIAFSVIPHGKTRKRRFPANTSGTIAVQHSNFTAASYGLSENHKEIQCYTITVDCTRRL